MACRRCGKPALRGNCQRCRDGGKVNLSFACEVAAKTVTNPLLACDLREASRRLRITHFEPAGPWASKPLRITLFEEVEKVARATLSPQPTKPQQVTRIQPTEIDGEPFSERPLTATAFGTRKGKG